MQITEQKQQTNQLTEIIQTSGLEKTKAQVILENFSNYFEIASDWEKKAKALVITDISQKAEMKMAREGRLFLKDKRVQIAKVHKELKEASLREGQTLDAIKRILTNLIEPIEADLEEKEKFAERKEAERKAALKAERVELLKPYEEVITAAFIDLENMPEDSFKNILENAKITLKAKRDEAARIEAERIAKEKAEAEERERIRIENERLKKEAEAKEKIREARNNELRPYIIFIRDYNAMLSLSEEDYTKEFAEIKIAAKQHYEYEAKKTREREAAEAEANRIKAEQQAQIEAERQARAKAEAELKAKLEAEEKERKEHEAAAKKAEKAPDKEKLKAWINSCILPNVDLKSKEMQGKANDILAKFEGFKKWANEQIQEA